MSPTPELRFVKELIRTEKCSLYKDFYCLKTDLLAGCGLRGVGGGPREVTRPLASGEPWRKASSSEARVTCIVPVAQR
jgi:hypothetical protein